MCLTKNNTRFIQDVLKREGNLSFTVCGYSMAPFLMNNQEVQIIFRNNPLPGDCVLYRKDDKLVLHRLVKRGEGISVFAGDNSPFFESVSNDKIIGVLHESCPNRLNKCIITLFNIIIFGITSLIPGHRPTVLMKVKRKMLHVSEWRLK